MLSDERAAFEEWCFANGLMAESHGVRSESRACDVAWLAWQAAIQPVSEVVWPRENDVGRFGDMCQMAHLRVGLDSDTDVYVSVWDGEGGASVEFCCPGNGGGSSPRTREALIALMVAMEEDNKSSPHKDWWAARNGSGAITASEQPASCSPKPQNADTSRRHVVESGNSEHVSVSGRVYVRDEPTPEVMAAAAIAVLNDVSPGDMELANQAALIVLKKVNAPHGLSLSAIATSIATMAPAYRAMIKAGQE